MTEPAELVRKASVLRERCEAVERASSGSEWSVQDLVLGLVINDGHMAVAV